jgi:branched-chain amino acid transport system substrate-binding protein
MRRSLYVLSAAIVASAVAIPTVFASQAVPGVTATTVTIGGTFSVSGAASGYGPIPVAMHAYFSYVNATRGPDGKRGVGGRQIVFKYYDDAYNPAQTVQLTRQLVEQDHVFALVGSLGTATQEARGRSAGSPTTRRRLRPTAVS